MKGEKKMATQMTIKDSLKEKVTFTDLLFSIKDVKAGTYSAPFVACTSAEAQRILTSMVCYGGENLISKYPSDYELYQIGSYDKRTGVLGRSDVVFVISADSVRNLETIRIANESKKHSELIKENSEDITLS